MNRGENRLFDVSSSGYLTVDQELREAHLTPETDQAIVQAIGTDLQILIPSSRDDIQLRFPMSGWQTTEGRKRRLGRNGIYIDAWTDRLEVSVERERGLAIMGRVQRVEVDHDLLL